MIYLWPRPVLSVSGWHEGRPEDRWHFLPGIPGFGYGIALRATGDLTRGRIVVKVAPYPSYETERLARIIHEAYMVRHDTHYPWCQQ